MFNPTKRYSAHDTIVCWVFVVIYIVIELSLMQINNIPNAILITLTIVKWVVIAACFIVGIIWRPNFRKPHNKQPKEEDEEEMSE